MLQQRVCAIALLAIVTSMLTAAEPERAGQATLPSDKVLFNGWGLTPAGQHVPISDMALRMIVAADGKTLLAVSGGYRNTGLTLLDIGTKQVKQFLPLAKSFNGLTTSLDGSKIYVPGGDSGLLHVFTFANGVATPMPSVKLAPEGTSTFLAGIAVHPVTGELYICNEAGHQVLIVDPAKMSVIATVSVGQHPLACAMGADKRHLYVSNWGNRSLSIIDTRERRRLRDITVGIRPNDMVVGPDGRLYVACAGDNTVHVVETKQLEKPPEAASPARRLWEGTREIISTSLYPQSPEGSTPDALAISPDGQTLFIANADNNNVAVVNISDEKAAVVEGFIPVGWYPTALAVSPDNQQLLVASGKGMRSLPNALPPEKTKGKRRGAVFEAIAKTFNGHISFIARPDNAQMVAYTRQARDNCPYRPQSLQQTAVKSDCVIPDVVGAPCPIKYVLYIIKENRTYDQVMGDFTDANGKPAGNGDKRLTIYGEPITPNQHQLARDYVLLDNLYCNGEVSVDGHSWCDAAIATDYNERSWIVSYSKHGKLAGNEEMENPAAGYLWDLCRRHGLSYKCYGEGAQRVPSDSRGIWPLAWEMRDMDKVRYWIDDLHAAEKTGQLPRFTIMSLGEDHTQGTTPNSNTPDACVASNDLAVGRIVEAASRSRFWKEMAIFIIEDDAQNGPDHVDAHRTTGFVISPWCKRRHIDSTLYTTASMVRTMELILGLPPLTQYDAGATPMFNCFSNQPDLTPYTAITPRVDLNAVNTIKSAFAKESAEMDFDDYDDAPEDALNRILWAAARGNEPYPAPIHRAFLPR